MIGDSPLTVDENGDVSLLGVTYEGTEGLWELLTKTNVDQSLVTPYDMRSYKRILESTNGHLSDNYASRHIKTIRGTKHRDVISELFPAESRRRSRKRWTTFRQSRNYITNPSQAPSFSSRRKLEAAASKRSYPTGKIDRLRNVLTDF